MSILNPSSRGAKRRKPGEIKPLMLEVAADLIHEEGLTVSLQHISLDAIASIAGISRSAVYRAWPNREQFFDELLLKLCLEPKSHPMVFDGETLREAMSRLKALRAESPKVLSTKDGRFRVMVEMCRHGATVNYENLRSHTGWRTWIALTATALSYPEDTRNKLQSAIAKTEGAYVEGMAQFYERLGLILGRQIRPQFESDADSGRHKYAYLAATGSATMEGLVLRSVNFPAQGASAQPDVAIPARDVDPYGTGRAEEWNAAAVTFTGTFLSMTEAVPGFKYDPDETDRLIAELEQFAEDLIDHARINSSEVQQTESINES